MKRSSAISVRADLLRVGLFAAVGVAIMALLATQLAGIVLSDRATYSAEFADVSGLREGAEVRVAGVQVGEVEKVSLGDGHAQVTFTVDRGIPMADDVHAAVRYKNLLGDRFLELLKKGGAGAPMAAGNTIPDGRTSAALDLDALLNGFQPLFRGLQPAQVNQLSGDLITVLQGQGGTVESLLGHIGSLTNTVADRDKVIGSVITNMKDVLETVERHDKQFSGALTKLQKLVSGLAADRDVVGSALEKIGEIAGSFDSLLKRSRPALKSTVSEFGRLIANVDAGKGQLEKNLKDLADFYIRGTRIGAYGSFTNAYLCGLQIKLTGPDGNPIYTPWIDSNSGRCKEPK